MTMLAEETDFDRIAGMLAHELRNPLAAAATNLAVASDLTNEADPRTEFLQRAEHEMDRIRVLLEACLDLARTGRVRRKDVDLRAMFAAIVDRFRAAGTDIEAHLPDLGELRSSVDPGVIVRAIENLCENARREAKRIRLTATEADGEIDILVDDDGKGMPEDSRDQIFEPFVTGRKGAGLGLAFVRQVATAHGGTASVCDSPLGGARFKIHLPAAPEADYSWLTSS